MRIHPVGLLVLAVSLGAGAATVPSARPSPMVVTTPAVASLRAKKPRVKLHQATGELLSLSAKSLVLLHARGRTKSHMVFFLTPKTKREGTFAKGERIIVYYHVTNGRREIERVRRAPTTKGRR